eukprot:1181430-Prorocentrum_minimum.AAC.1
MEHGACENGPLGPWQALFSLSREFNTPTNYLRTATRGAPVGGGRRGLAGASRRTHSTFGPAPATPPGTPPPARSPLGRAPGSRSLRVNSPPRRVNSPTLRVHSLPLRVHLPSPVTNSPPLSILPRPRAAHEQRRSPATVPPPSPPPRTDSPRGNDSMVNSPPRRVDSLLRRVNSPSSE